MFEAGCPFGAQNDEADIHLEKPPRCEIQYLLNYFTYIVGYVQ